MTVSELIVKLKKFNPDGNARVVENFEESPDILDTITNISMEEDVDGSLIVILHTKAM